MYHSKNMENSFYLFYCQMINSELNSLLKSKYKISIPKLKNKCNFYSLVGKNVISGMGIKKNLTKIEEEKRVGFWWLKIMTAQRRQAGVCALGICVEVKSA